MTFFNEVLRWVLRAFVFPILTILIVAIVIFNMIPQAEMRSYVADKIGNNINRQLEIGPMHFGLRGLSVDSLSVSDGPSFHSGHLFDAKGLRLGWELHSLWNGLSLRRHTITQSSGSFHVDDFRNPHYIAKDFSVHWSLSGIDSSLAHLNGSAKLEQGQGYLQNVDQLMATSPSAKVALAPVLALMNLEKLGVLKLGLPDLRHWPIKSIKGSYAFKDGVMTIKPLTIESPQLGMETTGTVDLPKGLLNLNVHLVAPGTSLMGALDAKLRVTGTTAKPNVDLSNLKKKAFSATITNILESPEIKNLFH